MLDTQTTLTGLENAAEFIARHVGPSADDQQKMLEIVGCETLQDLTRQVVPKAIAMTEALDIVDGCSEAQAIAELRVMAKQNKVLRSFIGQGYYNTFTPNVVQRNILENPAWYTAYTPYQPEISQGRLEALINFQTLVTDLTGMEMANASMLDEGTAAAEAMALCQRMSKSKSMRFVVDRDCLPQTIEIIKTRAEPMGIDVVVVDPAALTADEQMFGLLLQYPGASGEIHNYRDIVKQAQQQGALVVMAADILSLVLLESPGSLGADVAIGSTQRFGVPLGFGGPHAGYMATREAFKRNLPGRLVGLSQDANGEPAYRLALQTREQHIRREKATSNICTAQVLLAVIASMYAVYHGPDGLRRIAQRVHLMTSVLAKGLHLNNIEPVNTHWFDTLTIKTGARTADIHAAAEGRGINLRVIDASTVGVSLDETTTRDDIACLWDILIGNHNLSIEQLSEEVGAALPTDLVRSDSFLTHPTFNRYHSETEMLRYLRKLSDKDIALDRAMIPLGSCTMKLNATAEMLPITWPEFSNMHPFAPASQTLGYRAMIDDLEAMLCAATGYDAMSLQPNAGSQGEYAGLLAIRGYHESRGDSHRNVCLIPSSAHGTNPASAQMCGMQVVVVKCDDQGNVDVDDLQAKATAHSANLSAIMVTYPSTHGVFEERITEICDIVHEHGGQVYIDGANLNAMVGVCQPGKFGGDVSHLNLHKTFCIPHGGGGPGVGPIGVGAHLAPFMPKEFEGGERRGGQVSAAPYGSASILPITWMYIRMMGRVGLKQATEVAILNANYVATRLQDHYEILYTGAHGRIAHECILDVRGIKDDIGISVDDIAKRLIDYGFHAPTMSFPVAGTLMIEPTESESKAELDRFCDAMIAIKQEINQVASGQFSLDDNPLVHAPHTAAVVTADNWTRGYSRSQAAYPVTSVRANKYWPPVGRLDNVYGDRNLICSCPLISDYETAST
ncbi:MAG: aminomethyl-transferring glycine dehydrogenase [Porticoccaceae bacterium]|jgi:glycine dehydrogenase|nr:MAG: glycine dehydrogenase [SAR92 bacterium BACL16 MAG-120619-bin48]MDP4655404.1 aminomethyl-transferring glycine dehydrogenase [Alphaproteobacteria bacterium]MDP4744471.1 aminomethyl-transferring glycine dehydrogenase [Porticoccaceae bacterium]MDP4753107.1 aminomethyl-transferring glycine dehydrogenase [Porticoccaceae bacterium]